MAVLQRHLHVEEELNEKEHFLVDKLHIPVKWLHEVKVSAQLSNLPKQAASIISHSSAKTIIKHHFKKQ
jgi:hypothetical protein